VKSNRGTELDGATVLVTGGGNGIGRRMAIGAGRRGARVIVWDRSAERAGQVAREVGGKTVPITVDITDKDAVREAAIKSGPVDILVNNAGVVSGQRLLDATEEGIERTFAVNVLGLFWVTRAFLPGMLQRDRGTVVTVASAAGLVGVAKQTDYSASKHAAIGFDESLRAELRTMRSKVRTMVVCPYYVDTGMFAGVRTRVPWLLPILKEQRVAEAVLDGVEKGKRRVVLPPIIGLVPTLRILPVPVFDRAADLLGVNQSMSQFTGRPGDVVGR
jgi:all-trans-retinol dehydrogenase (NAD+)